MNDVGLGVSNAAHTKGFTKTPEFKVVWCESKVFSYARVSLILLLLEKSVEIELYVTITGVNP